MHCMLSLTLTFERAVIVSAPNSLAVVVALHQRTLLAVLWRGQCDGDAVTVQVATCWQDDSLVRIASTIAVAALGCSQVQLSVPPPSLRLQHLTSSLHTPRTRARTRSHEQKDYKKNVASMEEAERFSANGAHSAGAADGIPQTARAVSGSLLSSNHGLAMLERALESSEERSVIASSRTSSSSKNCAGSCLPHDDAPMPTAELSSPPLWRRALGAALRQLAPPLDCDELPRLAALCIEGASYANDDGRLWDRQDARRPDEVRSMIVWFREAIGGAALTGAPPAESASGGGGGSAAAAAAAAAGGGNAASMTTNSATTPATSSPIDGTTPTPGVWRCCGCGAELDVLHIDRLPPGHGSRDSGLSDGGGGGGGDGDGDGDGDDGIDSVMFPPCLDPLHNYETAWLTIEVYSQSLSARGVHWATAFVWCYPDPSLAAGGPTALFNLVAELLALTNDPHVELEDDESDMCFGAHPFVSASRGGGCDGGHTAAADGGGGGAGAGGDAGCATAVERWALYALKMRRDAVAWAAQLAADDIEGGAWAGQSAFMLVPDDHWLWGHKVMSWGWLRGCGTTRTACVDFALLSLLPLSSSPPLSIHPSLPPSSHLLCHSIGPASPAVSALA
jgi:hypothetical protein